MINRMHLLHSIMLVILSVVIAFLWHAHYALAGHSTRAIIDLEQVAQATGQRHVFAEKIKTYLHAETEKLKKKEKADRAEIEQLKKTWGDQPSPEQQMQLKQKIAYINLYVQQKRQQIIATEKQLEIQLVQDFRHKIEPIIKHVARKNHYTLVEIISPKYLYVSPAINISSQVIAAIQADPHLLEETQTDGAVSTDGRKMQEDSP